MPNKKITRKVKKRIPTDKVKSPEKMRQTMRELVKKKKANRPTITAQMLKEARKEAEAKYETTMGKRIRISGGYR
tara:strand:+ start:1258 stop:1482 length:225 start_codon:yes stop_codon:yes gene_type:complete